MVTIITEKLRNQSLDDVKVETVPTLQAGGDSWAFPTSPSSAFQLTGNKSWGMLLEPKQNWPAQPMPGTTAKTTTSPTGPAPRGGVAMRGSQALHGQPQTPIQVPSAPTDAKFGESSCSHGDSIASTPPAPPMKRHCRSLSIPSDRSEGRKWQPSAGQIWRPVAATSGSGAALRSLSAAAAAGSSKVKNRNSPLLIHRPVMSRTTPHLHHPAPPSTGGVAPAAGLVSGIWPLSKSEEFCTPPDSPVPRPASASSGFCENPVNSSWLEKTASSSTASCSVDFDETALPKQEAFRLRSLSMEEPIWRLSGGGRGGGGGDGGRGGGTGGGGGGGDCPRDARSMPAISGSGRTNHSTPSSPLRQRVLRCRSQPCVLHDRKCLKRRRDEERPALDFLKMTETAYDNGNRRNHSRCQPHFMRSSRSLASLSSDLSQCTGALNTIASSPSESATLPSGLSDKGCTAQIDPGGGETPRAPLAASSESRAAGRRWSGGSGSGQVVTISTRSGVGHHHNQHHQLRRRRTTSNSVPDDDGDDDDGNGEEEEEEEEEEDSDGNVGDDQATAFVDADEHGCDCVHGHDSAIGSGSGKDAEDGEMFELEMNTDLDLDQIEKD